MNKLSIIFLVLISTPYCHAGTLNWYRVNCIEDSSKVGICNAVVSSTISGIISGYAVADKKPFFCEKRYFASEYLHTANRFKPYAKSFTENTYTIKQQKSLLLSDFIVEYLKSDLPLGTCSDK
ncbi:hypothetical protein [Pseudoalteromonas sp. S1612]|uniref:hypothetical protein n=1 Tax=Pseudoalteromonas sp. S1612 TaxID=579507 RepID=UPI00110A259A|nr:hypothetical protein [Pseudoalteromonas sp. S1612]TMP55053.1 hypothetical protein CWB78_09465 [Pseudoalteromonas sp. S1612]